MSTPLDPGCYRAENANRAGSEFHDVNLSGARFSHVNLRGSEFVNVALTNAAILDACPGMVTVDDADYKGMRIEGILVTERLRIYREHAASA